MNTFRCVRVVVWPMHGVTVSIEKANWFFLVTFCYEKLRWLFTGQASLAFVSSALNDYPLPYIKQLKVG